ncbi:MAG: tRNA threonylcarbamoyladenosine dehydratase [Nannocystaceae bacterium]
MSREGTPAGQLLGLRTPSNSETEYRLHRRFDRMGRLVGDQAMARLFDSHVMVVGMGGVGSWAAESLVRSGVGKITLVDFDLICVTNANRQLHAMKGTTGRPKVEVMAERLARINPSAEVRARREFYNADTSAELLDPAIDLVVDAIDNLAAKSHLISTCRSQGIPLVVSGGASGRMDPTAIRRGDLAEVTGDPFLKATRKLLRKHHGFESASPWKIPTIYSNEPCANPQALNYDEGTGFVCVCPQGNNGMHTCDQRNLIYGTASFVTGAFGLACAAAAVEQLLEAP